MFFHALIVFVFGVIILGVLYAIVRRVPLPGFIPGWIIDVIFLLFFLFLLYYAFAGVAAGAP